jgi:prophage antirepressor-like protein
MTKKEVIKLFDEKKVRTVWDDKEEKWYFSIVDVVEILTDSKDPQAYWRKLKQRLKKEGDETVTNCHGLKMRASDGKMRMTDVADQQGFFRLIQSRNGLQHLSRSFCNRAVEAKEIPNWISTGVQFVPWLK